MDTNLKEFLEYLEEQVQNHSIYVWGAQGQTGSQITEAWIRKRETTEVNAETAIAFWQKQVEAGYGDVLRAFDCSGLGMYWLQNVKKIYTGDMNANAMMGKCETVTEPKPGYWVFRISNGKATHIGYLADEKTVIHAKGRKYGVVKEAYKAKSWNRIGRPACFSFDEDPGPEPGPDPGEKRFVWVLGKGVYVRAEGNKKAKKLGIAHKGELYELLGQDTEEPFWYRIDFRGRKGWISSNAKYTRLEGT